MWVADKIKYIYIYICIANLDYIENMKENIIKTKEK